MKKLKRITQGEYEFYKKWWKGESKINIWSIIQLWHRNKAELKDIVSFEQFVKFLWEGFTITNIKYLHKSNFLTITETKC